MPEATDTIVVYGTSWCGGSIRARKLFDKHGIPYRWMDIEMDDEAAAFVEKVNNGLRSVPTIAFPDGGILVEPSAAELTEKLGL
jgi:mycoredoxin